METLERFQGGTSVQEYEGTTLKAEYVRGSDWGGGVGGILYSVRPTIGRVNYHYNGPGDITTKTKKNDNAADIAYQASYEAYGTRTQQSGTDADPQKANTKHEDPTGLLNEGFRYRDLATGSFITRDPAGFTDGPNLYTYVKQNPWTMWDPEGLQGSNDRMHKQHKRTTGKDMDEGRNKAHTEAHKKDGGQTASTLVDAIPAVGTLKGIDELITGTDRLTGNEVNRWVGISGFKRWDINLPAVQYT